MLIYIFLRKNFLPQPDKTHSQKEFGAMLYKIEFLS
jgi:hypothetical protein